MWALLQHDDAAGPWLLAGRERRQNLAGVEGKIQLQALPARGQGPAVADGPGDQEYDPINTTVTLLQTDLSGDSLRVRQSCFRLDRGPASSHDESIPCPSITFDRKRNLESPAQRWVKAPAKALQERCVGRVSQRVASRIEAYRDLHPEDCREAAQLVNTDTGYTRAFDPPNLGVRHARGAAYCCLTESGANSRVPQLIADNGHDASARTLRPVYESFASGHRWRSSQTPLYSRLSIACSPAVQTSDREAHSGRVWVIPARRAFKEDAIWPASAHFERRAFRFVGGRLGDRPFERHAFNWPSCGT